MIARNAHHSPPYGGGAGGGALWGYLFLSLYSTVSVAGSKSLYLVN